MHLDNKLLTVYLVKVTQKQFYYVFDFDNGINFVTVVS